MRFISILTTVLAGAGLSSASRCKLSKSSASPSSSSVSPSLSASPSPSTPAGPTCGPEAPLMGTDAAFPNAHWDLPIQPSDNMYLSTGTCNVGGAQGCLSYIPTDSTTMLHVKWTYHAHDLVVGQRYTFSFQYWQNLRMPYYDAYMVSTGNPNEYASFFYSGNPPEWLTVTLSFIATDTTRDLTFDNHPSPNTAITFSNFNLYKACAQPV